MILIGFAPCAINLMVHVDLPEICAVIKLYLVVSSIVQILCTCVSVFCCYNMHMLSGTYEFTH